MRCSTYCRAELGDVDEALAQFHDVLDRLTSERGDGTETAFEVRRNIGELQVARNDIDDAAHTLRALHDDLLLAKGSDNDDTSYVAELLERLRPVSPG